MQVWARDPNLVRQGILPVLSAQCVLRESGVGTWRMTLDEGAQWSPLVGEGWGVMVMEEDRVLFSGPLVSIGYSQSGGKREVELGGVTDMHVLADRVVYPDPSKGYDQQTMDSHYRAKGVAETLLLDLVRQQCLPDPAWITSVRRTPGMVLPTTLGRGVATSVEARFTPLLDEVQTLATVGGLVVDVVQDRGNLVLSVRQPVDRSRSVRFMPGAGLGDYSMTLTAPTANTVILLGQGELTERTIVGRSSAERWGGRRIEITADRRDTGDADEYQKELTERLLEGGPSASATFSITEAEGKRFGVHYGFGDTVTVDLPHGGQISDGVRVADITWTEHLDNKGRAARDVKLTVGEHSTDEDRAPAWVKKIRTLQRQVRGLVTAQ